MKFSTLGAALTAPLLVLGLAACTTPTEESENFVSVTNVPVEPSVVTPIPVEPDTVLIVRATATALTGEQLLLEMQVHQAVPFDDVAAQTLPQAVVLDCPGVLTEDSIAAEQWSFTRATVTAIPAGAAATWPADAAIGMLPSAEHVLLSGRGDMTDLSDAADSALAACMRSKYLVGPGQGGLAVGLPADAADTRGFTGWSTHPWGFVVASGTLSNCTVEVTELGLTLGAGSDSWATMATESQCAAGPATEVDDF